MVELSIAHATVTNSYSEMDLSLISAGVDFSFQEPVVLGTMQLSPSSFQHDAWVLNLDDAHGGLFSAATKAKMAVAGAEVVAGAKLLGWGAPVMALFAVGQRMLAQDTPTFVPPGLLSQQAQQILLQLASDPADLQQLQTLFSQIQTLSLVGHLDSVVLSQLLRAYEHALMGFVKFQITRDPQLIMQAMQLLAESGLPDTYLSWRMQTNQLIGPLAKLDISTVLPPYLWWSELRRLRSQSILLEDKYWYTIDFHGGGGVLVH